MQANNAQIREFVITRLHGAGLRPPINRETDPRSYGTMVEEYIDAIYEQRPSPQLLYEAMTNFVRSWTYTRWPTIGELLKILFPANASKANQIKPPESPRAAWAEEILKLPEGQQALRNGYGRELYLWATRNSGSHPTPHDIEDCQNAETRFRQKFRETIDRAKKIKADQQEPIKQLVWSQTLVAGHNMDAFENKLKAEFLTT